MDVEDASHQSAESNEQMGHSLENMVAEDDSVTHEKTNSTKPLSSVWKHFTVKRDTQSKKKWAVCHYCLKDMYPHCDRMRRHLVICPRLGKICQDEGVSRLSRIQDVMKKDKTSTGSTNTTPVIKNVNTQNDVITVDQITAESMQQDMDSDADEFDEHQIGLIARLVQGGLHGKDSLLANIDTRTLGPEETTTHHGKPIQQLSDADLEREEKELRVQKLRLDVGLKKKQNLLYSRLNKNFSKIIKATEVLLENSNQMQSVHVARVYTSGSGDQEGNILHAAYQATMQDGQHHVISSDPQDLTFDPSKAAVSYSSVK